MPIQIYEKNFSFIIHADEATMKLLTDNIDGFQEYLKNHTRSIYDLEGLTKETMMVYAGPTADGGLRRIIQEVHQATEAYIEIIQRADRPNYRYGSALFQYDEDVVEIFNEEMPEKGSTLINKESLIACAVHLLKEKYNR